MGVSLFLCLPRVRSDAPSRAFLQARLDYVASLCHVFCVFAYVSGPLSPSRRKCAGDRGSGWFQAFFVSESCVFRQLAWFALNLFVISFRFCLRFS